MKLHGRAVYSVFLTFALLTPLLPWKSASASDFNIVVTEIHYNPLSGSSDDEFLEIYNGGGESVDLSNWRFVDGIALTFPEGLVLAPRSYLVVSPDAAHTSLVYGVQNVHGNYSGSLNNRGEILSLLNDNGDTIVHLRYNDNSPWPESPDGLGPSLEIRNPEDRSDVGRHWLASHVIHGTPGALNSVTDTAGGTVGSVSFVEAGEEWRYMKGTDPYPIGWESSDFNDSSWLLGATGIGYGDDDDETVLDDMRNSYLSFAARKTFSVTLEELNKIDSVLFRVVVDDAYVAYLNGYELGRVGLGDPGTTVSHNDPGQGPTEPRDESILFTASLLKVGENTLAVQVHNHELESSDVSFIPRLIGSPSSQPGETTNRSPVVINEIYPGEGETTGFVELYNKSTEDFILDDYQLVDFLGRSHTIQSGTTLGGGSWLSFDETTLGYSVDLAATTYVLVKPDGETFVTALNPRAGPVGQEGLSYGSVPDGAKTKYVMANPSPDSSNSVDLNLDVVINEIYFHPPFVTPNVDCETDCSDLDQWIELQNTGGTTVNLSGWELSEAVDYVFPEGTEIGVGGYLIVARSRDRFLTTYPDVNSTLVVGDWLRALSHGSDTIRLRDQLRNIVNEVTYGDGKPLNDENPVDDMDDGTFLGSEWPTTADGSGSTLELLHPRLNNSLGLAWLAGPVGGTPAAANASFNASSPPVLGDVTHFPPIPNSFDNVRIACRVSSTGPLDSVSLVWQVDGSGTFNITPMNDDGLDGDLIARDDLFSATVAPQSPGTIVAFQLQASNSDGSTRIPFPPPVAPYPEARGPFYLYQVLDVSFPQNPSANYMIIMTSADQNQLESRSPFDNVLLPATFIAMTEGETSVHHLVGLRYRGSQTRTNNRKSYRLEFPAERAFQGYADINLQAPDSNNELLAADFLHRAGLPTPLEWSVNLRFQGRIDTAYVFKEHLEGRFLRRIYGDRGDDGNLYRAIDPDDNEEYPFQGDISYLGPDPETYRPYYSKRTNKEEDDFSDIIALTQTFDRSETSDETAFANQVEQMVDVHQWMRFFAAMSCIANRDGSIHTRTGEDFFLYRVPENSGKVNAGKWVLLPWDIEESFEQPSQRLFRSEVPAGRRFQTHPRFAPLLYCKLATLRQGPFSRIQMRSRLSLIDFMFSFGTIDSMDAFNATRLGFFDETIPDSLTSGAISELPGTSLIERGALWRFLRGTAEPSDGTLDWTLENFDDSGWEEGAAGFGYGDGDDVTLLDDMENNYTTVYIRHEFEILDPLKIPSMYLRISYDDGFIAYLNGQPLVNRNVNGSGPFAATDTAPTSHEANSVSQIDVTDAIGLLRPGTNVLAIQGLNIRSGSSDFSLDPTLVSLLPVATSLGCGQTLFAQGSTLALSGNAEPCETRSVTINDQPAEYDPVTARWIGAANIQAGENIVTIKAFDRFGILIETREVRVSSLSSALTVSGTLTENTTWSPTNANVYILESDVEVPNGVTLDIEPGTVVFGASDASILVQGRLRARGTETNPILFRAQSCDARWGGIALDGTGAADNILRYCDLEFGSRPSGFSGFVAPVDSTLLVENSSFRSINANAIDGTDAIVTVTDCSFDKVREGVHNTRSTSTVRNSIFRRIHGDNDAIDFDFDGEGRSVIEGCVFLDGTDDGVDLGDVSVDIRDNVFIGISDKAISIEGNGPIGPPTITGNVIVRCGTAMALKDGVTIDEGHHNTIVGNTEGIDLFAKNGTNGGHGTLHSNIIWNNGVDVRLDNLSTLELTHSAVSQAWPGEGNISTDPEFVDANGLNFSLNLDSPCIRAGLDGSDMGAIPFDFSGFFFVRGDADTSGTLGLNDAVVSLRVLFVANPMPECQDRIDTNDDGTLDVVDPLVTLFFLFGGGEAPPAPYPSEGEDPTADDLDCFDLE